MPVSRLVIAEKPSVAASLAKVLKASARKDGYFEGNGWIVSWCVGHLVELEPPESYNEKYKKWRKEDLPILPDRWKYAVSSSTKKQFGILKKLMERTDITRLCCATDAGREGELIFRLVYHQAHCKKPFDRLWISSMEDSAIQDGFASLRPSKDYDALYEAALCREHADWIVGMNATRLYWFHPECGQSHDAHTGHAGGAGTVDPGFCAGDILYGAAAVRWPEGFRQEIQGQD